VDRAAWHLPGGPVGPASRGAFRSNVEVENDLPINRVRAGMEGREGTKSQRGGEEGGSRIGKEAQEPLAPKLGYLCRAPSN